MKWLIPGVGPKNKKKKKAQGEAKTICCCRKQESSKINEFMSKGHRTTLKETLYLKCGIIRTF